MTPYQQRVVDSFVGFIAASPGLFRNRLPIDDIVARYKEAVGILAADLVDNQTLKVYFPAFSVMGEHVHCYMIWNGNCWRAEIVAGRTDENDATGFQRLVANLPPGISQWNVTPLTGGWIPPPPVSPDIVADLRKLKYEILNREISKEKIMPSPEERDTPRPATPEEWNAEAKKKHAIEKLIKERQEAAAHEMEKRIVDVHPVSGPSAAASRNAPSLPIAPGLDPRTVEAHSAVADEWIRAVARAVHAAIRLGRIVDFNHTTDIETGDIAISVNIKGK